MKAVSRRYCATLFLVTSGLLLALAGVSIISTIHTWDGSFEQTEFRLTFTDQTGKPLEGVELLVTDRDGNLFPGYPISDYLLDSRRPRSGMDGQLVCRHVRFGLEFGGYAYRLFWLIPMGEAPPVFKCHFIADGKHVASCDYREIATRGKHTGKILRSWDLGDFIAETERALGSQAHFVTRKDRNQDGTVSKAERAAWNALADAYAEYRRKKTTGIPLVENRRFCIMEKDIVACCGSSESE